MTTKLKYLHLLQYFLFFFFFSALYQLLCVSSHITGGLGLRESFYTSLLYMIPILLFQRHAKNIAAVIGIFLWIGSLFNLGYFALYKQEFSQSVIFIMFETNIHEGIEFFKTFFVWWLIPMLIAYTLIAYLFWKKLSNELTISIKMSLVIITISLLLPFHTLIHHYVVKKQPFLSSLEIQSNNMQSASPWNIVLGYIHYKIDLNNLNNFLITNKKLKPVGNLKNLYENSSSTIVLVIGESTNRNRMSLYGYDRNTTPRLKNMSNELIIFDNVYTPRPYTIEVLEQALTFADQKHPNLYLTMPNLINIMEQAGYETYWITNQLTQSKRNTLLTTFSKICNHQIYLNNNRRQNSYSYDEKVLEPYNKILKETKIKKKFIIVHLLGTHFKYSYRYPEPFAIFDHQPTKRDLALDQMNTYNEYDNAVYYNDYIVSSLIESIKKQKEQASLLYLSDHGEEVYDDPTQLILGRNEGNPTSSMYTIPFILYTNPAWKIADNRNLGINKQKLYTSTNLLFTMTDLAGLSFDEFESSKSILSPEYSPKDILIGDPHKEKSLRNLLTDPF